MGERLLFYDGGNKWKKKITTLLLVLGSLFLQSGKNCGMVALKKKSGVELLPHSDPRREVILEKVLRSSIYSN
jgi:hypothetical protein